jgi:hypothetical protein
VISKSPEIFTGSSSAFPESSMFNTFESDLEILLADWQEDGASFSHFTTTLHDDLHIMHDG